MKLAGHVLMNSEQETQTQKYYGRRNTKIFRISKATKENSKF